MNEKQFAERIGNVNDQFILQAEQLPNYGRSHRKRMIRRLASIVAAVVLMMGLPVLAKLPMDANVAALCDSGEIERVVCDELTPAVDAVEALLK